MHILNGRDEHWEILEFADDRALTPAMRAKDSAGGTFAPIQPVHRDASGVWHCTRDFRVGGGK